MQSPVYLDYNATTPCLPEVVEAMLPYFSDIYGNPSSYQHLAGWKAEEAVEMARDQIAALLQARSKEIIFTSGATEALNLAIKGLMDGLDLHKNHVITAATEHKAVLDSCQYLKTKGLKFTYLPVNRDGLINLQDLQNAIRPETGLITVMMANNETGVIQPTDAIYKIARQHRIPFLTDATQAVGKMQIDASKTADFLCISAHKMYGPKGIGCLYINKKSNYPLLPQMHGGGHENKLRSGTLNVPSIVGFGKASSLALAGQLEECCRIQELRDLLENTLLNLDGTQLNGARAQRLPNVSNISFLNVEGTEFLKMLNLKLAVSSGSACSSVINQPSHVLTAMGISPSLAMSSVRFALGKYTTKNDIYFAIEEVKKALSELRH